MHLQPHTGRRHQLRLHSAHNGHAIVGDLSYADDRLAYRMVSEPFALQYPSTSDQIAPSSCDAHVMLNLTRSEHKWN